MKKTVVVLAVSSFGVLAADALAHNVLTSMYAPAGYTQDLEMRVTHGCKGSPVKEVRMQIPAEITRVTVGMARDWQVETKMKKLPKPIPGEGGNMITEVVEQITWKNPKSMIPAMDVFEGFKFRVTLPDTPGKILFFKTINVCEKGDDKYIDMPTEALSASTPGLGDKLWKFMSATPGPAPFLVLEKPSRPQYPFTPPAPAKAAAR